MNTLLVREATPQQINAALLALSNSLGKSTEEVQQILATTSKIIELTKAEYEPIQQAGKWEKDAIYLVTDQSITGVVVDQHYSATSSNAQSGTAVAEAIADRVTQSQLSGALTNLTNTINALNSLSRADTRDTNEPPSYYIGSKAFHIEFKKLSVLQIASGDYRYGILITLAPFSSSEGGLPIQICYANVPSTYGKLQAKWTRYANDVNNWGSWD